MDKFDNKSNNNNNYNTNSDNRSGAAASYRPGDIVSVLFVGVGGQGIIMASRVLAYAAINAGFDVKVSEVHGMAQRGGSVEGSVRFGNKVYSPIIDSADYIIALEKLEALRYIQRLDNDGTIIINDHKVFPSTLYIRNSSYPDDIEEKIKKITRKNYFIKAVDRAKKLGEIRAANIILLGFLSRFLPIKKDFWIESIKENIKHKAVGLNIEAFNKGREECP